MRKNSFGVHESITIAGGGPGQAYAFRHGMGMMPSAEWSVFFDDFRNVVTTNVPTGWAAAVIDVGATVTQSTATTAGAQPGTGIIAFASANASEGAAIYLPKSVMLVSGKKFLLEARVLTTDVTDNAMQVGLSDLTATANPEDLWTTVAANVATIGILDGSALVGGLFDEGNGGTSAKTGTRSMVATTWHVLSLYFDGVGLYGYLDGKQTTSETTAANIATGVLLAPFIGCLNGNGAGGATNYVDWIRVIQER